MAKYLISFIDTFVTSPFILAGSSATFTYHLSPKVSSPRKREARNFVYGWEVINKKWWLFQFCARIPG